MTKGPVGKCRYCGQEFMYRQSLYNHETKSCPERPDAGKRRPVKEEGPLILPWEEPAGIAPPEPEPDRSSRAITHMGQGVQVWRRRGA